MKKRNKSKAYKLIIEIVLVIGFASAYAIPFYAISTMKIL